MTIPVDIHTHQPELHELAIISVSPHEFSPQPYRYYSVGIHPWQSATAETHDMDMLTQIASHPQVVAIGECGIDRLQGAPVERQIEILITHIRLSETLQKPLILHVVRAFDLLLGVYKRMRPSQKWIIHGFRGNTATAHQLITAGYDLSYGEKYQLAALQATPLDRLWIESDESLLPDDTLLTHIAEKYPCATTILRASIERRMKEVFFSKI